MFRGRRIVAIVVLSSFAAVAAAQSGRAIDDRLVGAWIQSPDDCAKTFEKRGGRLVYREPRDQFSISFIITARTVMAPGGDCRIDKAATAGDVTKITMTCSNGVGFAQQTSQVKAVSATELLYSPTGDPDLASLYKKCAL